MFEVTDIFTYISKTLADAKENPESEYKQFLPDYGEDELTELDEFIKFGRNLLSVNRPLSLQYLDNGFGIRLASGHIVTLQPTTAVQQVHRMRDEGIHITKPQTIPGFGMAIDRTSVPVTGV